MENNPQEELETKAYTNKDMWLFLIVLDVIVLCVFGFFLYKHFVKEAPSSAPSPAVTETVAAEKTPDAVEVTEEEVTIVTETPVIEGSAFVQKPEKETPVVKKKPEVKPEVKPVVKETPVQQEVQKQEVPAPVEKTIKPMPAKKSVEVSANSSKYRRVTFRWFEPAKTVAIVSGFTNRKPQPLKKVGDYWETTLSIAPGTYKFLYIIDGKNATDPYSQIKDGRSVLIVK